MFQFLLSLWDPEVKQDACTYGVYSLEGDTGKRVGGNCLLLYGHSDGGAGTMWPPCWLGR